MVEIIPAAVPGFVVEPSTPALALYPPPIFCRLAVGRPGVFLGAHGGGGSHRSVAPCVIRLTYGSRSACLKDYRAFEIQVWEASHTIRLGVELARKVEADLYQVLSLLEPGQVVDLDTVLAGGFKGLYMVQDVSSVSLAEAVTFDILLKEVG